MLDNIYHNENRSLQTLIYSVIQLLILALLNQKSYWKCVKDVPYNSSNQCQKFNGITYYFFN